MSTVVAMPTFRQLLETTSIILLSPAWDSLKAYSQIVADFKGRDIHIDLLWAFDKYPGPWTICAALKLAFKVTEKFPLRSGMTSFLTPSVIQRATKKQENLAALVVAESALARAHAVYGRERAYHGLSVRDHTVLMAMVDVEIMEAVLRPTPDASIGGQMAAAINKVEVHIRQKIGPLRAALLPPKPAFEPTTVPVTPALVGDKPVPLADVLSTLKPLLRTYSDDGVGTNAPVKASASVAKIAMEITTHEASLEADDITRSKFILALQQVTLAFPLDADALTLVEEYNTSTMSGRYELGEKLANSKASTTQPSDDGATWARPDKGPNSWSLVAQQEFKPGELVLLPCVRLVSQIAYSDKKDPDRAALTIYSNAKGHPLVVNRSVCWARGKEFLPPFWLVPSSPSEAVNMTLGAKTVSMCFHTVSDSANKETVEWKTEQVCVPCMYNPALIERGTLLGKEEAVAKAKPA